MSSTVSDKKTLRVVDTWTRAGITPNPKQREFAEVCEEAGAEEVMFSGSIRAGKSQAAAKKQVRWAWEYPGTTHLVVRRTYPQLRDSTWPLFKSGDGGMPAAIPDELIAQTKIGDWEIHLKNRSKLIFRSADDPQEAMKNVRNVTLASIFVDQIEEFDRDADPELYETWLSRLSDPRGPRKLIAVANPGPTTHFAYKRFHPDSDEREPQTRFINVTIYDNFPPVFPQTKLPLSYLRRQERRGERDPMWFKRFCLGEWGAFGGKRFRTWNPDRHLIAPFPVPQSWDVFAGIDYGWHDDTVELLLAIDHGGRYYAVGEYTANQSSVRSLAAGIKAMEADAGAPPSDRWLAPDAWATRSEEPSIAAQFNDEEVGDLECGPARTDRLSGWDRIDDLLTEEVPGDPHTAGDEEGSRVPRLRFFRGRVSQIVRELPNAKIKEGTNDIEKQADHALDALRYGINARPPTPLEPEDDIESDPREAYARKRIREATEDDEIVY